MGKRLVRSTDKKIAGVIGGIAEYFDVDPTILRVGYALLACFTGFIPALIAYFIMVVIIPEA